MLVPEADTRFISTRELVWLRIFVAAGIIALVAFMWLYGNGSGCTT
jgi:hypothetical protein